MDCHLQLRQLHSPLEHSEFEFVTKHQMHKNKILIFIASHFNYTVMKDAQTRHSGLTYTDLNFKIFNQNEPFLVIFEFFETLSIFAKGQKRNHCVMVDKGTLKSITFLQVYQVPLPLWMH